MPAFATIAGSGHVTLWEENPDGSASVTEHLGIMDAGELPGDIEIWTFDVPTSMETKTAFNAASHPYLDADMKPVWKGARMKFAHAEHHINIRGGSGEVVSFDPYGNVGIVSDLPIPIWFQGRLVENRTSTSLTVSQFVSDPVLGGIRKLASGVGDPHEHGRQATWLRVEQDPRDVCSNVLRAGPKP